MTTDYTLYYAPGACSISPHIALREAGLPFALSRVDLRGKKIADGSDWLAVNPKGYVPALRLPSGEVITEGAVIVRYIADQAPTKKLAPANGTLERVRVDEMLHFIATEIHKGMSPLFNAALPDEMRKATTERVSGRYAALEQQLGDKPYLFGDFTIADGYAFYVLFAWQKWLKNDLAAWPKLAAYYARLVARPSVAASLEAEGIKA
jgi:glutathione S-transferase